MKALAILILLASVAHSLAVSGTVFATDGPNILILETGSSARPYLALTNYSNPRSATMGKHVSVQATRIGIYNYGDAPIELWLPTFQTNKPPPMVIHLAPVPTGPPLSAEEIAKRKAERQAAEEKRKKASAASTVKWLQEQADQGDASAEFSLGQRYLKGDGVDKDEVKAREYLTKASQQGNQGARDLLASLPVK